MEPHGDCDTSAYKDSPHRWMLAGTVRAEFDRLRERGAGAGAIAGAFRRSADVVGSRLVADTSTRAGACSQSGAPVRRLRVVCGLRVNVRARSRVRAVRPCVGCSSSVGRV